MKLKLLLWGLAIVLGLGAAHIYLNVGWDQFKENVRTSVGGERHEMIVGFLPVTCHLTCPVTSWVTEHSPRGSVFRAHKFMDFPSMKEAFISRQLDAAFVNMPLAMKLAGDGVPTKIVYLGHRDGTTLIVPSDGNITDFAQLKGKKVAIPGRFSNQAILMRKMMDQYGMGEKDITLIELPPPEHPGALANHSIDAYIIGEPHAAKAEMMGFGRPLYFTKDIWPNFISCGLMVRQELIDEQPELVQELVSGIARSGKWLDSDRDAGAQHRKDAAVVAGEIFYNQDPKLLEWALTRPIDRVKYTGLKPLQKDFDEIMDLGLKYGVFDKRLEFAQYVDDRFAPNLDSIEVDFDRLPMPTEAEVAAAQARTSK